MIGIVVVAHAPLATALLSCGTHVLGTVDSVVPYDVGADDDPDATTRAVLDAIRRVDQGSGVLVLVDLLGATPANAATRAIEQAAAAGHEALLVAGVNAPMLLRVLTYRHLSLADAAHHGRSGGVQGMVTVDCGAPPAF